jgi:very-short-patch-repair endonuclease
LRTDSRHPTLRRPRVAHGARMHAIQEHVLANGGLAATYELYGRGWTRHDLRAAVNAGVLVRVRQGWYCLPETPDAMQRAARVGGHLTCRSGAHALGLQVRLSQRLHVTVAPNATRLRTPGDRTRRLAEHSDPEVVVHWTHDRTPRDRFTASALQCLLDMTRCESPEWVVAAADSAIRRGDIRREEWDRALLGLPARHRLLLARVDPAAESILESITRFRLRMLGLDLRAQVRIPGVGRVDLVVGERLVIELDGWEFHRDREQFEEDRRRDAALAALGYVVLRFTYRQITREWSRVRAAVLALEPLGWVGFRPE